MVQLHLDYNSIVIEWSYQRDGKVMPVATTDILIEPLRDGSRTNQILCWHFCLECHDSAFNGIYIH